MNGYRSKKFRGYAFVAIILGLVLSACSPDLQAAKDTCKTDPTGFVEMADGSLIKCSTVLLVGVAPATAANGTAVPATANTAAPAATATPSGIDLSNLDPFTPDWTGLAADCKTVDEVLADHGLTTADLVNGTVVDMLPNASWEPCMVAIELKPELQGKKVIPLVNGYQYTADTPEGDFLLWGGDPQVLSVTLAHGTTFRWGPTYVASEYGKWLDPNNPLELAAREYRFGRYLRDTDWADRPDNPYFQRQGSYYTHPGNLDTNGWLPPSLDETVPKTWMDACAMLGGLCNQTEWKFGEKANGGYLNWAWAYEHKVAGSPDYCPIAKTCWQQVYHPGGPGYLEVWLSAGTNGPDGKPVVQSGPYKFYEGDQLPPPVDEFSVHIDPNR